MQIVKTVVTLLRFFAMSAMSSIASNAQHSVTSTPKGSIMSSQGWHSLPHRLKNHSLWKVHTIYNIQSDLHSGSNNLLLCYNGYICRYAAEYTGLWVGCSEIWNCRGPWQMETITAALQGNDALIVQPTGAGKSLCFTIPSLIDKKTAVVISPTISLMTDQVRKLTHHTTIYLCQRDQHVG